MIASSPKAASPVVPDVSIVVPTFCEERNLAVLVPRVHAAIEGAGLTAEILVVDDNSPDRTIAVCEQLAEDYPVRLITRHNERGLSSAVLCGLTQAAGNVLLVMDADLSHPPEKLPELVAAIGDPDVDFVIGSRYVSGAETDEEWGFGRWVNSKAATLLARPFTRVKDPMAGFFALRRTTFQAAPPLNPIGYKIGLELLVKCDAKKVAEVPIHFNDRLYGESKLNLREQVLYLRHLVRLAEFKLGRWARLAKFLLVGLSGSGIDLVAFGLLFALLPVAGARAVAIWVAMTWNFYWNRRVTFSDARSDGVLRQYVTFCGGCLAGAVVNWGISVGLCSQSSFFASHPVSAAAIGIVAGTAINYFASCRFAFRGFGN